MLRNTEASRLLQQTLDEEATEKKLTQLAEQLVNVEAVEA
jgi:ferritin-like metal-binding protein YciE